MKPFIPRLFKKRASENIDLKIKDAPKINVNYKSGLSDEQVQERKANGLDNRRSKAVTTSYLEIVFKDVFTILNILLIATAIVMCCFGLYRRCFFVIILVLNIGIGLFQDIKAKRIVDKLSLLSNPRAEVVRNGSNNEVPFEELVLSDVIILKAGKTIPCDATILYGSVRVNESFISGESNDVIKNEKDTVYAESYVSSGLAYAQITKIGNANYAVRLQEKARMFHRPSSEILKSLRSIIRIISIAAISLGLAETITYIITGKDLLEAVEGVTSSIVAMIPIGMYLITSITLTVGVIVLSRHRMLVRELYSIEMLARVNVLCLDKTGTLTDGRMKVKKVLTIGKATMSDIEAMIGNILFATKDENITARALRNHFALKSIKSEYSAIPFSSDYKYSAVSFNKTTYIMGAYGFFKLTNDKETKELVNKYEKEGGRILVIAAAHGNIINNKLPNNITAVGVIMLMENVKKDARKNINWFRDNGVDVRIISGDSAISLTNIAVATNLANANQVISLDNLSDAKVKQAARKYKVFARVSPEQKKLIIDELRTNGNTVAMIGDGVNDVLALKQADCSIAMANGADAAKSVSHLVSLDSNFSSLPKVVEEGRRVINNLQRVCSVFLVKTIFAIFMSTLFLIFSWFHKDITYPFRTNHLMLWEFLTIGIAPFFLALEPNKDRINKGFIGNIINQAIPAGIIQIIMSLPLLIATMISPNLFPSEGSISMLVLMISVMSAIILLRVSLPMNRYRKIVISSTFVLMAAFIVVDYVIYANKGAGILDIKYYSINNACLLLGLLMFILSIPAYILLVRLFKYIRDNKQKKKHEKRRTN